MCARKPARIPTGGPRRRHDRWRRRLSQHPLPAPSPHRPAAPRVPAGPTPAAPAEPGAGVPAAACRPPPRSARPCPPAAARPRTVSDELGRELLDKLGDPLPLALRAAPLDLGLQPRARLLGGHGRTDGPRRRKGPRRRERAGRRRRRRRGKDGGGTGRLCAGSGGTRGLRPAPRSPPAAPPAGSGGNTGGPRLAAPARGRGLRRRPGPAGRAAGGLGPGAMTARGTGPGHTCGKRGEPAVSSVHLLTHTDTHRSRFLVCSTKHKSIFALNGPPLLHNFSSALPQGFGRYVSHCHADTPRSTLHAFTPSYTEADLSPASPCCVLTSSCPKSGGRTARV